MDRNQVITLNNGVQMPALGLGVLRSDPEKLIANVKFAIDAGYRMIDTAAGYHNEEQVGEGIRRSGVARSEIFVITKLWLGDYGYDETLKAFDVSLDKLGLDYLDLYLLHWPSPSTFDATIASYRAAEKLLAAGRVRAIGVCNFNAGHLEELIKRTEVIPALNQVELHPYFIQRDLRSLNARHGITTQAWSPIGGTVKRSGAADPARALDPLAEPKVRRIAEKHRKTPAQVILRWHIQNGVSVIPKSSKPERITENIDVFDFELSAEDLDDISSLDTGKRSGADPETMDIETLRKLAAKDREQRQSSRAPQS